MNPQSTPQSPDEMAPPMTSTPMSSSSSSPAISSTPMSGSVPSSSSIPTAPLNGGQPLNQSQITQLRAQAGITADAGASASNPLSQNWSSLTPQQRLQQLGFNPDGTPLTSAPSSPSPVPQGTSLPQRLASDTEDHAANITEDLSQKPSLSGALDVVGNVAGEANDIVGEPLKSLYTTNVPQPIQDAVSGAVKSIAGTPEAQGVVDAWNKLSAEHPEATKALGNIVNIAGLMGMDGIEPSATSAVKEGIEGLQEGSSAAKATADVADTATSQAKNSDFIKDLVTPEMTVKDLTTAMKTGKVTEGAGLTGERDITGAVKGVQKMTDAVSEVPGISAKNTALENLNAINDHIGTVASDLRSQVVAADEANPVNLKEPFTTYMNNVKSSLAESPMITGDAEKTAGKILDKFQSLVDTNGYTREGILDARQGLDKWMASQKGAGVFDPAKESAISTALKAIRQGGNDFLAEQTPDVAVKDMLAKQTSLYNAVDNIAPKAAKEGGTRLQQLMTAHPFLTHVGKKALEYGLGAVGAGAAYEGAKAAGAPLP